MKRVIVTVVTVMILLFCGCRETPAVIIDPVENQTTTTTTADKQEEQVIDRNLKFTDLLMFNGSDMKWSWFRPYRHQLTSDTTAEFKVESTNDPTIQATLVMTFDATENTIDNAELTYADVTVNILTDDIAGLYAVLRKMVEAEKQ